MAKKIKGLSKCHKFSDIETTSPAVSPNVVTKILVILKNAVMYGTFIHMFCTSAKAASIAIARIH